MANALVKVFIFTHVVEVRSTGRWLRYQGSQPIQEVDLQEEFYPEGTISRMFTFYTEIYVWKQSDYWRVFAVVFRPKVEAKKPARKTGFS
jgi:hypothetical protein